MCWDSRRFLDFSSPKSVANDKCERWLRASSKTNFFRRISADPLTASGNFVGYDTYLKFYTRSRPITPSTSEMTSPTATSSRLLAPAALRTKQDTPGSFQMRILIPRESRTFPVNKNAVGIPLGPLFSSKLHLHFKFYE